MIRRFHVYMVRPNTTAETLQKFERMFQVIDKFCPQVHESFIGRNLLGGKLTHTWEHSFDNWDDFRIYIVHPYHINVLDRYLLPGNPECIDDGEIVVSVFYETKDWQPSLNQGLKRLVVLQLHSDVDPRLVEEMEEGMRRLREQVPGMIVSSVARNGGKKNWRSKWTHIWEQVFADKGALKAYLAHPSPIAELERNGWKSKNLMVEATNITMYWKGKNPVSLTGDSSLRR